MLDLKTKLATRISIEDVLKIVQCVQGDTSKKQKLYALLYEEDDRISWNTAWILNHFSLHENKFLYAKQNELIDMLLVCKQDGKRRLILSLLYRQALAKPPRVYF